MVWLYYITAIWPPQCSVTVGGATQGSLSSLWACRSRDGRGYQDLSLDFLLTLLCALNECWTLIIHISSFGPKNSEVLFHHGTHQRSELPQTGAMVQIQRRKPQHEADVRRGSGQIQQVQVKHMKRASAARELSHIYTGGSSRLPLLHHIYRASDVSRTYILIIRPIWANLLYITQFMHCFCKIASSFNIRARISVYMRISLHLSLHVNLDFHVDVARLLPHQTNSLELQVPPSALLHLLYIFICTHIHTLIVCLTVYLYFKTANFAILAARHIITRSLIVDHVCLSSACTLTLLLCAAY